MNINELTQAFENVIKGYDIPQNELITFKNNKTEVNSQITLYTVGHYVINRFNDCEYLDNSIFNISIRILRDENKISLDGIFIPPQLQKQGIGSKLISLLATFIRDNDYSLEILMVDCSDIYEGYTGVSTHLINKFGLTYFDEELYEFQNIMNS